MGMEIQILNWIQELHTPLGDMFWPALTKLGNAGMIWILLAVVLLLIPGTRRSGLILAAALLVDMILCNGLLKPLIARIRPYEVNTAVTLLVAKPTDFSFPSGHTAAAFTSAAALFFAGEKRLWKAAFVLAVLLAFSRLYLYVHYPTDVMGGMIIGIITGYAGNWIINQLEKWKKLNRRDKLEQGK